MVESKCTKWEEGNERMSPRVRFRPGDHFTRKCTVHLPDCFEKIEKDRSVRPIDLASPPILNLSKRILYNDPHLIVLNKPANLCCQVVGFSSLSPSRPQPRSTASTLFCTRSFRPISSIPCIVWIGSPSFPAFIVGHNGGPSGGEGSRDGQSARDGVRLAPHREDVHRGRVRPLVFAATSSNGGHDSLAHRPGLSVGVEFPVDRPGDGTAVSLRGHTYFSTNDIFLSLARQIEWRCGDYRILPSLQEGPRSVHEVPLVHGKDTPDPRASEGWTGDRDSERREVRKPETDARTGHGHRRKGAVLALLENAGAGGRRGDVCRSVCCSLM